MVQKVLDFIGLHVLPQISIFVHYLTLESVKIHPRPFQTNKI